MPDLRHKLLFLSGFALALILSRWPLIPEYLSNFDLANFAFALDEFNPPEHKPHPPGYPLFVGLTRLIRLATGDPNLAFVIAGLLGSFLAVIALAKLAEQMFGARAALIAAILLTFHPAMWTAGLLNPVRVFLVAGTCLVGLAAWNSWKRDSSLWWSVGAWGLLGAVAGFRPELGLLLMPVCVAAGIRRRNSVRAWTACAGALAVTSAAWVAACAQASGGPAAYFQLLVQYLGVHSSGSSLLYGASLREAAKMAGRAIIWAGAPLLIWGWVAVLLPRRVLLEEGRRVGWFLAIWCGPSLASITLLHSAEPGHVLPIVAPVCLLGGWMLATQIERRPAALAPLAAAVAGLSIALFFWPPARVLRPSSVVAVRLASDQVGTAMRLATEAAERGSLAFVAIQSTPVVWRILAYYFPKHDMWVLHDPPGAGHWLMRHGELQASGGTEIQLRGCSQVLWLLPSRPLLPVGAGPMEGPWAPAVVTGLPGVAKVGVYDVRPAAGCDVSSYRTEATAVAVR